MLTMPEVGNYDDVCKLLHRSKQTVYIWACYGKFPKGVYLGKGIFNMSRLLACMEAGELFKPVKKANRG